MGSMVGMRSSTYQRSGGVHPGRSGVGAVQPLRLRKAEDAMIGESVGHFFSTRLAVGDVCSGVVVDDC